jgi:hypothetical protein
MLPGLTVPASLADLLATCRSCFSVRVFPLFTLLTVGMIAQTGPRTVTGILIGAGMQQIVGHDRVHRFFTEHTWSVDALGLAVARLIVTRLLPAGASLEVAVDDTLFKRRGKQVHGAFWTHDASAQGHATARGNRWITLGLVVQLPFLPRPVCLPVLFRLWAGKGTATPVELARTLIGILARAWPDRPINVACDAAYHGKPFRDLPARITVTTRPARNSVLYHPAPPPTGRPGRPRSKGQKIGTPAQAAATATWRQSAAHRYGRIDAVALIDLPCLWYGAFGNIPGRLIGIQDTVGGRVRQLMLFTTDLTTTTEDLAARYAARWTIETAFETAKQFMGVGQARNRVANAVQRTVPFGMLTMTIVYLWYTLYGHHRDDIAAHQADRPWNTTKTDPSFEDMLAKLRRTIIAARCMPERPGRSTSAQIQAVHLAWAAAAA